MEIKEKELERNLNAYLQTTARLLAEANKLIHSEEPGSIGFQKAMVLNAAADFLNEECKLILALLKVEND